jgi:hypothetical protein
VRPRGVERDGLLGNSQAAELSPETTRAAHGTEPRTPPLDVADRIRRRFFKRGIVVVLAAGVVWGARLPWRIATGAATSVGDHHRPQ